MRDLESSPEGETAASFDSQLEALIPDMRAFARYICHNPDLADDVVQDTCMKAWAARDRFIPGAPMKPWLFQIIRNVHAQIGRRAWRSVPLDPSDAEKALIAPDLLEWSADLQVIQALMNRLPVKQREAMTIVLAAGFSYEEAGQILGCSEGTVKSRVSRGREALIHMMGQADRGCLPMAANCDDKPAVMTLTTTLHGPPPQAA